MRQSLLMLLLVVAALAAASRAQAQNYPWCAIYSGSAGGAQNCGFVSFQQCMENVSGIGGFCMENNLYRPPPGPAPAARRPAGKRRARSHS